MIDLAEHTQCASCDGKGYDWVGDVQQVCDDCDGAGRLRTCETCIDPDCIGAQYPDACPDFGKRDQDDRDD